jgi:hypothetical protein
MHQGKHQGKLLGAYKIHLGKLLGKYLGKLLGAYKIHLGKLLGAYRKRLGKRLGKHLGLIINSRTHLLAPPFLGALVEGPKGVRVRFGGV